MEHLCRVPRERIAVLIGKQGSTREMIGKKCGGELSVDSQTGDVSIVWEEDHDPIKRMKAPEVISAIGRGVAPKRAIQLLEDDFFMRIYDIREWVGRQPNQVRRMRSRLIGRNGRIRTLIEEISNCEIAIYGSTVVIIGGNQGLALASPAIEGLLGGSEHSTVLFGLEQDKKRNRLRSKNLDTFEDRVPQDTFESMVPGLSTARKNRARSGNLDSHGKNFELEDE